MITHGSYVSAVFVLSHISKMVIFYAKLIFQAQEHYAEQSRKVKTDKEALVDSLAKETGMLKPKKHEASR